MLRLASTDQEQLNLLASQNKIHALHQRHHDMRTHNEPFHASMYEVNRMLIDFCIRLEKRLQRSKKYLALVNIMVNTLCAQIERILFDGGAVENYPAIFLSNICVATAMPDALPDTFNHYDLFKQKQLFHTIIQSAAHENRIAILTRLNKRLGVIIKDGNDLAQLLTLPPDHLSTVQCGAIFDCAKNKLGSIIKNGNDLAFLFELSPERLSSDRREFIWDGVKERLNRIIKNGFQMNRLFNLSNEQLSADQRDEIWSQLKDKLDIILNNGAQFCWLFRLSIEKFDPVKRDFVINRLKDKLHTAFDSGADLVDLFKLSTIQFSDQQRALILELLKDKLSILISNENLLQSLFALTREQLIAEQRITILKALLHNKQIAYRLEACHLTPFENVFFLLERFKSIFSWASIEELKILETTLAVFIQQLRDSATNAAAQNNIALETRFFNEIESNIATLSSRFSCDGSRHSEAYRLAVIAFHAKLTDTLEWLHGIEETSLSASARP